MSSTTGAGRQKSTTSQTSSKKKAKASIKFQQETLVVKRCRSVRVNIRVPEELSIWAKSFALANGTTLTDLVVGGLMDLRRRYGDAPPKVEQL